MRLAELYLRSRLAGFVMIGLTGVALLGWGFGRWILAQPFVDVERYLAPVLLLATLVAACIIGIGTSSPFGHMERTSSFPLSVLRFFHLAGLLAWSTLTLTLATSAWNSDYAGWALVRNLAGFSGLVLLAACVFGSRLSWVAPFGFYTLAVFTGRTETFNSEKHTVLGRIMGEVPVGEWERWAWAMRPYTDYLSWILALALLIIGLAWVCFLGARELAEDQQ